MRKVPDLKGIHIFFIQRGKREGGKGKPEGKQAGGDKRPADAKADAPKKKKWTPTFPM